ncbi:Uncharacterized protein APZ42_011993 [Daphnia magna]|uniref:Uncharacterized protein n=1 Tax=Daphnia magna TaxID=35525 RepID=A0A162SB80_9CRUS|nr:Uncharacterized protein APZ42_011993 [Daphnia magna]
MKKMTNDRFETNSQEKEVGILIVVDHISDIVPNEAAIESPCGLRAYNTKLGRMIEAAKQRMSFQLLLFSLSGVSLMGRFQIPRVVLVGSIPVPVGSAGYPLGY